MNEVTITLDYNEASLIHQLLMNAHRDCLNDISQLTKLYGSDSSWRGGIKIEPDKTCTVKLIKNIIDKMAKAKPNCNDSVEELNECTNGWILSPYKNVHEMEERCEVVFIGKDENYYYWTITERNESSVKMMTSICRTQMDLKP